MTIWPSTSPFHPFPNGCVTSTSIPRRRHPDMCISTSVSHHWCWPRHRYLDCGISTSVSRHRYLNIGLAHRHRYLDISIATSRRRHRYLNIDPGLAIITRSLGAQNVLLVFLLGWLSNGGYREVVYIISEAVHPSIHYYSPNQGQLYIQCYSPLLAYSRYSRWLTYSQLFTIIHHYEHIRNH